MPRNRIWPLFSWSVVVTALAVIALGFWVALAAGCVSTSVQRDTVKRYTDGTVVETHTRLSGLAVYEDGLRRAVSDASAAMGTIWEQVPDSIKVGAAGLLGVGGVGIHAGRRVRKAKQGAKT